MGIPWAALAWAVAAGFAGSRALVRPHRGRLTAGGAPVRCSGGAGCTPGLAIATGPDQAVLSPVNGRVTRVGSTVDVVADSEAVTLRYSGLRPSVQAGQRVRNGETIGVASEFTFAVSRMLRDSAGKLTEESLVPSAWLAARGMAIAARKTPSTQWCGQGRRLVVPAEVGRCGMKLPEPARFALLPVSVSME